MPPRYSQVGNAPEHIKKFQGPTKLQADFISVSLQVGEGDVRCLGPRIFVRLALPKYLIIKSAF
eukprot:538425-Pelagomonas_calceolata.AAC.1